MLKALIIILILASLFIPRKYLFFLKKEINIKSSKTSNINFENNKVFVSKYKAHCLKALSYYPELENIHIEFCEKSIGTTMAARPIVSSFFNLNYERKYEVVFNNDSDCEVPFEDLPEEGQIGILGHELAHILDFEKKSLGQLILIGSFYINAHTIRNYERRIDNITLNRGLGKKLHDAYHYILEDSAASDEYKAFKNFTYLKPQEILEKIQK